MFSPKKGHRYVSLCEFSGRRVKLQLNVWFTFPGFQNSLPRLVSHKPYGSIFSTTCPATQGTLRGVNDELRGHDDAVSGVTRQLKEAISGINQGTSLALLKQVIPPLIFKIDSFIIAFSLHFAPFRSLLI